MLRDRCYIRGKIVWMGMYCVIIGKSEKNEHEIMYVFGKSKMVIMMNRSIYLAFASIRGPKDGYLYVVVVVFLAHSCILVFIPDFISCVLSMIVFLDVMLSNLNNYQLSASVS